MAKCGGNEALDDLDDMAKELQIQIKMRVDAEELVDKLKDLLLEEQKKYGEDVGRLRDKLGVLLSEKYKTPPQKKREKVEEEAQDVVVDEAEKEQEQILKESRINKVAGIRYKLKQGKLSFKAYSFIRDEVDPSSRMGKNMVDLFRDVYCPLINHEVSKDIDFAGMLAEMRKILKI